MPFDDGLDDDGLDGDDDSAGYRPPLPPDDRLWRHPSELSDADAPAAQEPLKFPSTRVWSVALVSGLVGALLATGLTAVAGGFGHGGTTHVVERDAVPLGPARSGDEPPSVTDVAERVRPAIVQVVTQGTSASGVLFRDDGHILTNERITEGATSLTVVLADGRRLSARLVGSDADTDVAVVKIDGGPFPTAVLGSATWLRTGDACIAIGSPLGSTGGPSVSVGVVSALGRAVAVGDEHLYDMIQTDAAIAPGASGGALLDRFGAVIGVTVAVAAGDASGDGAGFATPIDIARSIASELIDTGKATHVWLGVEGADVDQATAEQLKLTGGATIKAVAAGSPAGAAGLHPGDVIVAVEGAPVTTMAGLVVALRSHRVGDRVTVSYLRDATRHDAVVTLQERKSS